MFIFSGYWSVSHTHTRLPAPPLEVWSYTELNPNCLYGEKKQRNMLFIILEDICLKFLDQKTLLRLFLNSEILFAFPEPFFSLQ